MRFPQKFVWILSLVASFAVKTTSEADICDENGVCSSREGEPARNLYSKGESSRGLSSRVDGSYSQCTTL